MNPEKVGCKFTQQLRYYTYTHSEIWQTPSVLFLAINFCGKDPDLLQISLDFNLVPTVFEMWLDGDIFQNNCTCLTLIVISGNLFPLTFDYTSHFPHQHDKCCFQSWRYWKNSQPSFCGSCFKCFKLVLVLVMACLRHSRRLYT